MKYIEIATGILSTGEKNESELVSTMVYEKYHVKRATLKKKEVALKTLLLGYKSGLLKKTKRRSKIFWSLKKKRNEKKVSIEKFKTMSGIIKLSQLTEARNTIKKLEDALSTLCKHFLIKAHGSKWTDYIPEYQRTNLSKRFESSKSNPWLSAKPEDILVCANISDFSEIINENWILFKPIFKNKYILIGKLEELSEYRNQIQHNMVLSSKEYLYFNLCADLLLHKFPEDIE